MSLSIAIPSECGVVKVSPKERCRPKRYPLKSDGACWFSAIYALWTPDQVHEDLVYRLRELVVDYDIALTGLNFDDKMEVEALSQEIVITSEFENIFWSLTAPMVQEVLEVFQMLQLTKAQYLQAKMNYE
jgi:hypothetical protein